MRPEKSSLGAMPESMIATLMPVAPVIVPLVAMRGSPRVSRSVFDSWVGCVSSAEVVVDVA